MAATFQGKKGLYACLNLNLHAPATHNRTFKKLSSVPFPLELRCLDKEAGGTEQLRLSVYVCRRRPGLQNNQRPPHSSHNCQGIAGKKVLRWCQGTGSETMQSKQSANLVAHSQQQSSSTNDDSVFFNRESMPLNAHVQDAGRIHKTRVQTRTASADRNGCERYQTA